MTEGQERDGPGAPLPAREEAQVVEIREISISQLPCGLCGVRPARIKTTVAGLDSHTESLPCETCEQLWPYFELKLQSEDYDPTHTPEH